MTLLQTQQFCWSHFEMIRVFAALRGPGDDGGSFFRLVAWSWETTRKWCTIKSPRTNWIRKVNFVKYWSFAFALHSMDSAGNTELIFGDILTTTQCANHHKINQIISKWEKENNLKGHINLVLPKKTPQSIYSSGHLEGSLEIEVKISLHFSGFYHWTDNQ